MTTTKLMEMRMTFQKVSSSVCSHCHAHGHLASYCTWSRSIDQQLVKQDPLLFRVFTTYKESGKVASKKTKRITDFVKDAEEDTRRNIIKLARKTNDCDFRSTGVVNADGVSERKYSALAKAMQVHGSAAQHPDTRQAHKSFDMEAPPLGQTPQISHIGHDDYGALSDEQSYDADIQSKKEQDFD